MPRYLLETSATTGPDRDRASAAAAHRFPEVAIEHRFTAQDDSSSRDIWVCRAPSEAHVRRWAHACHLGLAALQSVGPDNVAPHFPRSTP